MIVMPAERSIQRCGMTHRRWNGEACARKAPGRTPTPQPRNRPLFERIAQRNVLRAEVRGRFRTRAAMDSKALSGRTIPETRGRIS